MKLNLPLAVILAIIGILGFSVNADAASLSVNTAQDTYKVNDQFNADIKIDSEDIGVNAGQATIKFSPAVLEVVSIDRTGSVFNFWIQDPKFDNNTGEVSFIGGASSGLVGKSLQVLRIVFKAKGLGQSDLIFSDGAVTASDGSGTNVLSQMIKAAITISSTSEALIPVQIIERTPVQAAEVPAKPVVVVPLYSNPNNWYNTSSRFSASWQLPSDVSAVATELNKDPAFNPTKSGGVFSNETFPALSDGVWYLHVRFYNNIGWSTTNHYRIAIDTATPASFEATFSEDLYTGNPAPEISYRTVDQLSGIDHYYIQVDNRETTNTSSRTYILPIQKPGRHAVKVGAQDKAGNRVETSYPFEIIAIDSPKIVSVTTSAFSGEGGLLVDGNASAGESIILEVRDQKNNLIYSFRTNADENGNWAMKIDSPLKNGIYYVYATAEDSRGAQSLSVISDEVKVTARPIIQLGSFQLGVGGAAVLLLLILIFGFIGGVIFYRNKRGKIEMRVKFSESETAKIFKIIMKDVDAIAASLKTVITTDDEYAVKKLREDIDTMASYLKKGLEKIKK